MIDPFYGRERELGILKELLDSNTARLVVLRGRRRIGKSRLAEQFGKFFNKHLTFVGLPPEKGITDEVQRRHFANELEKQTHQHSLLVLNNRQAIQKLLAIPLSDIKIDNPYFQRSSSKAPGVQIDYMIQTRFNTLYICEIKFHKEPIGQEIIKEMEEKLKALILPRGFSIRTVLIHVNGVKEEVNEREFFSEIIDFSQLLFP